MKYLTILLVVFLFGCCSGGSEKKYVSYTSSGAVDRIRLSNVDKYSVEKAGVSVVFIEDTENSQEYMIFRCGNGGLEVVPVIKRDDPEAGIETETETDQLDVGIIPE